MTPEPVDCGQTAVMQSSIRASGVERRMSLPSPSDNCRYFLQSLDESNLALLKALNVLWEWWRFFFFWLLLNSGGVSNARRTIGAAGFNVNDYSLVLMAL